MKIASTSSSNTRASAIRQFFEILEQKFGGTLPMDSGRNAEIIVRDSLRMADLKRLFQHEATALHIPNYYPRASALELGAELAREAQEGKARNWKVGTSKNGLESSDVFTLGAHVPYNMAVASQSLEDYYVNVHKEFRQRRRDEKTNIATKLWPMDQFRLDLDQAWLNGAGLARDASDPEKCKGGGLPRIMLGPTRWKKGFVHVDELAVLKPSEGFFSANIYLQLPEKEQVDKPQEILEIWPLALKNRWDWYTNAHTLSALSSQDAEGQVLLRKALGEPLRVAVQPGDLVLLCVQRPHAAIGFSKEGIRVSLQCFLQYSGLKDRLLIEG